MRIVLITPDLSGTSGWSRYALDLGKALHGMGHEIHAIVHQKAHADWCTQHVMLRDATHYLDNPLLTRFGAWRLSAALRKIEPDVVHFIAEPYAQMLRFLPKGKWATCMTIHGTYSIVPLKMKAGTRRNAAYAYMHLDRIISVSHFTKNYVKAREPLLFEELELEKRIHVIGNAIDLTNVPMQKEKKMHTEARIISVSAVKKKKGYLETIDAVAAFKEKTGMAFRYDIIGSKSTDTAFAKELEAHIAAKGLSAEVYLHGRVPEEELREAYDEADLFLMLSLQEGDFFEGFGLVFLEANARGIPVIGANTGGCPEAIEEGKSGYVCDPADATLVAKRMREILEKQSIDPADCRAWAEKHDVMKTAEKVLHCYAKHGK